MLKSSKFHYCMFIEEPALESIYHLVDSLISYLNTEEALSEKRKFQSILLLFKKDPIHQVDFFRDQMINFIKKLIKLSAVPNPSHILKSFKSYINHYITDLNNQDDSDVNKCFKNENEEAYNSFLLREGQKRSTKDYYKFLQEFEKIKHEKIMTHISKLFIGKLAAPKLGR